MQINRRNFLGNALAVVAALPFGGAVMKALGAHNGETINGPGWSMSPTGEAYIAKGLAYGRHTLGNAGLVYHGVLLRDVIVESVGLYRDGDPETLVAHEKLGHCAVGLWGRSFGHNFDRHDLRVRVNYGSTVPPRMVSPARTSEGEYRSKTATEELAKTLRELRNSSVYALPRGAEFTPLTAHRDAVIPAGTITDTNCVYFHDLYSGLFVGLSRHDRFQGFLSIWTPMAKDFDRHPVPPIETSDDFWQPLQGASTLWPTKDMEAMWVL